MAKKQKYKGKMCILAMEECAELQQAISKKYRGRKDNDNLTEEIADVLIFIEMIMNIYSVNRNNVQKMINSKIERMEKRYKNNSI